LSSDFPTVMILAGGLGTRLGALYEKTPKSLVKVADAPFIDHQLRLLARKGASTVILLLAHLGDQIADFVKDGCQYKLKVQYSYDGETLLGTGGAIKKALTLVSHEFAVIYGDSYLDLDCMAAYKAFRASGTQALMTVLHNENRWGKSNVAFANGLVQKYGSGHQGDQLNYIDYGFSILSKTAFAGFDHSQSLDLSVVFQDLIDKQMLAGFEVTRRFYEIGSLQGLQETDEFLRTLKD
jgi:NDP-sugar pyrophosphorylase family protein